MKGRVLFRADGNLSIGYGHFVRTLGLAELINNEFECIFFTQKPTEFQLKEIKKFCNEVVELQENESHFDEFLTYLKKDDIVVLDNYFFSSNYQDQIRLRGCKVIFIDDHNDKDYVCDILINNIPGFPPESFKRRDYTKLFLGTDYALIRKQFFDPQLRQIKKKPHTFFLSFGGADFFNISAKIIGFLNMIDPEFHINLLIGDAYKFHDNLKNYDNVKVYKNVNAEQVAELMAGSEICITPASSLLNEAACIGSKILLGYFADNQKQPYNYFVNNDLAIGLGDYRELTFDAFKSKLEEVSNANFLIENQKKKYHYQQFNNLKNIFYEAAGK